MNKDAMREIPLEARIQLQVSDRQVKIEMQKCKQLYFHPSEFEKMDSALGVMLNCLKCERCDRIPLELQECAHCAGDGVCPVEPWRDSVGTWRDGDVRIQHSFDLHERTAATTAAKRR